METTPWASASPPTMTGLAPPGRVVKLLDGGEEGVQIYQQDGRALPRRQVSVAIVHWPGKQGHGAGPEWGADDRIHVVDEDVR